MRCVFVDFGKLDRLVHFGFGGCGVHVGLGGWGRDHCDVCGEWGRDHRDVCGEWGREQRAMDDV
jgi:hypothetical protein